MNPLFYNEGRRQVLIHGLVQEFWVNTNPLKRMFIPILLCLGGWYIWLFYIIFSTDKIYIETAFWKYGFIFCIEVLYHLNRRMWL